MNDKYSSFQELSAFEEEGVHYQILHKSRKGSAFAIVAPHGGTIEPGTSEIARTLADDSFTWYLFESKRPYDDDYISLHITSHLFDEPQCIELIKNHQWVVTIHGCHDTEEFVYLGGLEKRLISSVGHSLDSSGIPNSKTSKRFPGTHRNNLCNKGKSRMGLQVEISVPLRETDNCGRVVRALQTGLVSFLVEDR